MRAILPAGLATVILGAVLWQAGCNNRLNYVSEDHFAAEYAQALCTSLQPCCAENGVAYSYDECAAGWQTAVQALLTGPNATGNYNIQLATSCIDQVRAAQGATCQPLPGSLSAARVTCQGVFAGTLPLGAPCSSALQCQQMDGSVIACAVVPGDAGGGGGQLPLGDPSVSLQGVSQGVTVQDVPICVAEAPPDAAAPATPPACSIQAAAGTDTCTSTGGYCDPMAMTCMPFQMAGGMCDPAVLSSCLPGNYCVAAGASAGTCAVGGPVGSPCTATAMCDATGYCDAAGSKTCLAIQQPGQSCTDNSTCSIGECDPTSHTCLANAIATTAACTGAVTTP
jgi:hypothetical protein